MLASNFNIWNTCLKIIRGKSYALSIQGELEENGCWPNDALWLAEKDGFIFKAENPIELLGLVGIHEHARPDEDVPYWWYEDCPDIRSELMRSAFPK